MVMARGLTVTAVGVGAGVVGALSAGGFVAPLLFEGRSPRDPLALTTAAAANGGGLCLAAPGAPRDEGRSTSGAASRDAVVGWPWAAGIQQEMTENRRPGYEPDSPLW